MYCPNCGAEVPEGVKFCPNCGSLVEPPKPADPEPQKPAAPAPEPQKAPGCEAPVVPEKKRKVPLGALIFAALAIGPFLNNAITGIRDLVSMIMVRDPSGFIRSASFFGAVLLFLAALFLIICLVRQIPNGKRPVLGGIALLLVSLASVYYVFGYLAIAGRALTRWPTLAYLICYIVCTVLFLICAILAFADKRFAALGLIAALVYLALHVLILIYSAIPYFRRTDVFAQELFNSILPLFASHLCHFFFGIALLLFSLKFRPAKK